MYLAFFCCHFFLVLAVSCQETLSLITRGFTIIPASPDSSWRYAETIAGFPLARTLPSTHPVHEAITTYLHLAGIECGYDYFAPNIPGCYKLVFELHYPDGHVEHALPRVSSSAAELRVAGLLDQIGRTDYEPLRNLMIKMLAHSVWREHPDATMVRAVFGVSTLPSPTEFEQGKRRSYDIIEAYDFTLDDEHDDDADAGEDQSG